MSTLEELIAEVQTRQSYKGKTIKTVGELKQALAGIADGTPLAIADHGFGWGIKKPFLSERFYETDSGMVYCAKEDPNKSGTRKLPVEVCVLEPSVPALDR